MALAQLVMRGHSRGQALEALAALPG